MSSSFSLPKSTNTILITGISGFIGYHTALRLKKLGASVIGIDACIPYYDIRLKDARNTQLAKNGITVIQDRIENESLLRTIIEKEQVSHIVHLAAQAGVRHSLVEPWSYLKSNIDGFLSVLEATRHINPKIRTVWASSSSVYGLNTKVPFSEEDITDAPANLYGATKKSNELMAFSYHHLFNLPLIGLRFFTVYGPWGRPDMAYYSFAEKIMQKQKIVLFGKEELQRDFTYIDDIVDGIIQALFSTISFGTYNLGGSNPESVLSLVHHLENSLQRKADIEFQERPKGDIKVTYADIHKAETDFGFSPKVPLKEGIEWFCSWFLNYKKQILT